MEPAVWDGGGTLLGRVPDGSQARCGEVACVSELSVDASPQKRVAAQVGPNGTLPLEDKRTKSENYHTYNTVALLRLALLCGRFGAIDLYSFTTADGRGLLEVVSWLEPYATGAKPWPFVQIEWFDPSVFIEIFRSAAVANASAWAPKAARFEAIAAAQPGFANARSRLLQPI